MGKSLDPHSQRVALGPGVFPFLRLLNGLNLYLVPLAAVFKLANREARGQAAQVHCFG